MTTTPTIWKPPFIANSGGTAGAQSRPQSIGLANGNILVVWEDNTFGPGTGLDIVGGIFSPLGILIGSQFQVNSFQTADEQYRPKIAALPDGGFVMVYASHNNTSQVDFLVVERFNSAGTAGAVNLITNAQIGDDSPYGLAENSWEITVNAQGDYIVAFETGPVDERNVHAFVYNYVTNNPGPEHVNTAQNEGGENDDQIRSIATFANGDIISVSHEPDAGTLAGFWTAVEFRITSATGAALTTHFEVGGSDDHPAEGDDVAVLTGGKFVIVYHYMNASTDEDDPVYYAMRICSRDASNNITVGPELRLSELFITGDVYYDAQASIVALPDGGFYVAWADFGTPNIVGTRFSANGTVIGNQASEIADDRGSYVLGDLSLTNDGRILASYRNTAGEIGAVIIDPRETFIVGTNAGEVITTQNTSSFLYGEGGNDRLYGLGGDDFIQGGTGNDTVTGGAGGDTIHGDEDNDTLYGDQDDDSLFGDAGNDFLDGGPGRDTLNGGPGEDTLAGGLGDDTYVLDNVHEVVGGFPGQRAYDSVVEAAGANDGIDTVFVQRISSLFGYPTGYTLTANVENGAILGSDSFSLTGNALANVLTGNGATNTINGLGGNDTIEGGAGADTMDGGTGINTLSYVNSNAGVYINLGNGATGGGHAQGDNFAPTGVNFQNLIGSAFNDVLFGDGLDNVIEGRGGADTLHGGTGTNTLSYASSSAGVYINLGNGGTGGGDAQGDNFAPSGVVLFQNITGSGFNDVLFGDGLNNVIEGGAGADTLYGGSGVNTLSYAGSSAGVYINFGNGGTGGGDAQGDNFAPTGVVLFQNAIGSAFNDVLFGNGVVNVIDGGAGADTLYGGSNDDTFQFRAGQASGDTVIDFTGNGAAAGDAFAFFGFGTAAQGATFTQVGATTQWQIHSGLDGHNEIITLSNGATVHQNDFLFA